jgi:hypothetical protein
VLVETETRLLGLTLVSPIVRPAFAGMTGEERCNQTSDIRDFCTVVKHPVQGCRLLQRQHLLVLPFWRGDQGGGADADGVEFAVEVGGPEIQEFVQTGEFVVRR